MSLASDTDYSFWKTTKRLKNPKASRSTIRKVDDEWTKTGDEKAIALAKYLFKVFRPYSAKDTSNSVATLKKIKKIISNLEWKRTPDIDIWSLKKL